MPEHDEPDPRPSHYTFAQARELAGVDQTQITAWAHEGRFAVIVEDSRFQIPVAIDRPTFDQHLTRRAAHLATRLHATPTSPTRVDNARGERAAACELAT